MKKMLTLFAVILAIGLGAPIAEAKKFGGGKSFGKSYKTAPAQPAPTAAPVNGKNPTLAAAPKKSGMMGGLLGGLLAGGLFAYLLGSGAFEGLQGMDFLLIALLALVVMVVIGMVMRARKPAASQAASSPFAFQGAGAPAPVDVQMPRQYNPEKVGNDASARPWEQFSASPQQGGGSMIGSALAGSQNWGVPADFDAEGFLAAAKRNFTTLQAAWDRSDIATLRSMMTDGMLDEIRAQLAEREAQRAGEHPNHTEVVILEAQLLGIEDLGDAYMASVEFSGMIREEPSAGPSPFREVWNMTKPKSGTSGWLVAGLQALQ